MSVLLIGEHPVTGVTYLFVWNMFPSRVIHYKPIHLCSGCGELRFKFLDCRQSKFVPFTRGFATYVAAFILSNNSLNLLS